MIRELRADVVALQEVSGDEEKPDTDQFVLLADALRLEAIEGPTLRESSGRFGNALLTRLPVRDVHRLDLSESDHEARGALAVDLERDGLCVRVVATHLGLGRSERRRQVDRLLAWIETESRRRRPSLLALAGDINEWLPTAAVLRRLNRYFGRAPSVRTFPAGRPMMRLDRIWATPVRALERLEAHRSPLARVASDHLPVHAWLDPTAPADPGPRAALRPGPPPPAG